MNNVKTSTTADGNGAGSKVIVFILGNCEEWPKNRKEIGDVGLFEHCSTFAYDICFVKDNEACTRVNAEKRLEDFLRTNTTADTLLFYYGGHGTKRGMKMADETTWEYVQLAYMVEVEFLGSNVWYMFDCCYSGAFGRFLRASRTKSYLAIMSSHPDHPSNDIDWPITGSFVEARSDETVRQVLDQMSDRHVLISNDWMQCRVTGDGIDINGLWPFGRKGGLSQYGKQHEKKAVQDKMKWRRLVGVQKNDKVYAKKHTELVPLYEPAVLTSEMEQDFELSRETDRVKVKFNSDDSIAEVSLQRDVLSEHYFDYCMYEVIEAHSSMAKYGRYFDSSIAAGTHVYALWKGTVYGATVMREPHWERCRHEDRHIEKQYRDQFGAFLFLEWDNEDGNWSLVPRSHLILDDSKKPTVEQIRDQIKPQPCLDPYDAWLKGMESQGKRLIVDTSTATFSNQQHLQVFLGDDEGWAEATLLSTKPSLKTIEMHLYYEYMKGDFYCVVLLGKSSASGSNLIVPSCFLRIPSSPKAEMLISQKGDKDADVVRLPLPNAPISE